MEELEKYLFNELKYELEKYCIMGINTGGISKPEYKKDNLIKNLDFEKCTENEKQSILNELLPLLDNSNLNICYFPIYKINNQVYSVNETDDDIEVIKKYLSDGQTVSIFSAKVNEHGIVVYRYNVNI
jgi:hypothetical protein